MFKTLIGRGHPEFSTRRQQDAQEFLLHLISLVEVSFCFCRYLWHLISFVEFCLFKLQNQPWFDLFNLHHLAVACLVWDWIVSCHHILVWIVLLIWHIFTSSQFLVGSTIWSIKQSCRQKSISSCDAFHSKTG